MSGLLPIIQADAQRIPLAAESVQCCVTSPPYFGARDYGGMGEGQLGLELELDDYVRGLVWALRECRRVLRKDGTLWIVLGDAYARRGTKEAGGNLRDRPRDKKWDDWAARQSRPEDARRLHAPRIPEGLKPKDLMAAPWRVALALQRDGWWLRSPIIWQKPGGAVDSATDRVRLLHEYVFMLSKSQRYYFDATYRNWSSVWCIPHEAYGAGHTAVFPTALVRRCVVAGSREGDVVLDPFCGSGTTVEVAYELRRIGVGLDLVWDYCKDHAAERFRKGQAKGRQTVMAL